MNTEWIGLSILITNVITFLGIIGGVIAIVKYLLEVKKELSDFKVESKLEMSEFKTEVRVELVKLQSQMAHFEKRFDKYDGVNTELDKRVAEIQKQQTELQLEIAKNEGRISEIQAQSAATDKQVVASENRINAKLQQVETENRDFIKELVQTVSH